MTISSTTSTARGSGVRQSPRKRQGAKRTPGGRLAGAGQVLPSSPISAKRKTAEMKRSLEAQKAKAQVLEREMT